MSVSASIMMGIVGGLLLFFVLQQTGVIDRWIERWDRR